MTKTTLTYFNSGICAVLTAAITLLYLLVYHYLMGKFILFLVTETIQFFLNNVNNSKGKMLKFVNTLHLNYKCNK